MSNECLPKLLRSIAGGENAKASKQDVVFNAAADVIDRLHTTRSALQAVIAHWNEFGPEHGFEETVHRAEQALNN